LHAAGAHIEVAATAYLGGMDMAKARKKTRKPAAKRAAKKAKRTAAKRKTVKLKGRKVVKRKAKRAAPPKKQGIIASAVQTVTDTLGLRRKLEGPNTFED
jgi:hypothetical protein